MTAKRFVINNDMNLGNKIETYELSCLVDNENKTFYFIVDSIANVESFVERLNELSEENQLVKDTLNELKSIDGFWDSALLQGYIGKIANILGVDLE